MIFPSRDEGKSFKRKVSRFGLEKTFFFPLSIDFPSSSSRHNEKSSLRLLDVRNNENKFSGFSFRFNYLCL